MPPHIIILIMRSIIDDKKISKLFIRWSLVYMVYGTFGNYFNLYFTNHQLNEAQFILQMSHVAIITGIIIVIAISVLRRRTTTVTWGFTLDKGCWISLLLCILVTLPYLSDLKFSWLGHWFWDPVQIESIMMEELICRVMLITGLVYMFRRFRRGRILAVIISTIVFIIPHIPTHSAFDMTNFVLSIGLVFGFAYLLTGSILFPLYAHVMTNLGEYLGYTAGMSVIIFYFIVALLGYRYRNRYEPNSQSLNNEEFGTPNSQNIADIE